MAAEGPQHPFEPLAIEHVLRELLARLHRIEHQLGRGMRHPRRSIEDEFDLDDDFTEDEED